MFQNGKNKSENDDEVENESSWNFRKFRDSHNAKGPFNAEKIKA